jgi:RNA polymerase sigma factor (sigma-70 family)
MDTRSADVMQWEPLVKKMARKWWFSRVDQDDLLQAGMIGVWQAIEKREPGREDFLTFVCVQVRSHIRKEIARQDYLKEHVRRDVKAGKIADVTHEEYVEAANNETPLDLLIYKREVQTLQKYFPLLPERWQQLLLMRYEEDLTWSEIGARAGLEPDAAKGQCKSAVAKLKAWSRAGRHRPVSKNAGATPRAH